MKNFVRSRCVLLALLCSGVFARRAGATQTWTATFEKDKSGDVCSSSAAGAEFSPGVNETKGTRINAQVLGEQVYSGGLACKVTVHPDDTFTYGQNRVDIQHKSTLTAEGMDSYISGHYMMPADAQVRNEIGFYETLTSSSNAMDFWVAPKGATPGMGTTINFAIGNLPMTATWTADFTIGVWHQIGIHVHWSQMATVGYVDLWFDGVKVATMLKGKTKPDGNNLFYQTGLHRRNTYQVTDTIYFDDFYEGDSEADMHIAAPMAGGDGGVAPSDGGAADSGAAAAGAGGAAGTTGAAGTGATGAAGTAATGAAGTGATGSAGTAGAGGTGATAGMGTSTTGAAGTSGGAGTGATGAGGSGVVSRSTGSSGCTYCPLPRGANARTSLIIGALVSAMIVRRRRRN